MAEQEYYLENKSYKKILFHSLKYQTKDTIGILIGEKESNLILISDVYPLCHLRITLSFLETAFQLIEAQLQPNQFICGVYETLTTDKNQSGNVSLSTKKILNSIQQQLKKEPLLIKFREQEGSCKIQCLSFNNNQIQEMKKQFKKDQEQLSAEVMTELKNNLHLKTVDIEEHLEEPCLDFTNSYLN